MSSKFVSTFRDTLREFLDSKAELHFFLQQKLTWKRFVRRPLRLYLRYLPCHPTVRSGDFEWAKVWNARSAAVFKRLPFLLACLAVAVSFFVWPVVVGIRSWRLSGQECKREAFGLWKRIRFFIRLVATSLRHRLNPVECYRLELALGNRSAFDCRNFLSESLALPLLSALNDEAQVDILGDKRRFHDYFLDNGIATVRNLAIAGDGHPLDGTFFSNCREDVFFKPKRGSRSLGVERWDWSEEGFRKAHSDMVYQPERLTQYLRELSERRVYLVQPRLRNHPDVEDLSNGSVIVFRVLSVRFGGAVELIAPVAQLPFDNVVNEYWRERVVSVAVDLDTGVLSSILGGGTDANRTGGGEFGKARIVGRVVPNWSEGMELLRRAHEALPGMVLVGWDLVFTPEGPQLIEGNSGPGLLMHQLPPLRPLRVTGLWSALVSG